MPASRAHNRPLRIGLSPIVAEGWRERILAIAPGAELIVIDHDGVWQGGPAALDALFLSDPAYEQDPALTSIVELLRSAPPPWLQTANTGVDHMVYQLALDAGCRLTNAPGVHGGPIAEYVFAHILHHAKRLRAHHDQARVRQWRPMLSIELAGQTLGIVGYGGIGRAIAKRAKAFEMQTIATKRNPPNDPNLDRHLTPDQLGELLSVSDYVVLCVPLTDATVNLIGAAELALMQPHALLINVARGRMLDLRALHAALVRRRLAGAVLDVSPDEPPAPDALIWKLPRTAVTPHDACDVPAAVPRTVEFFLANLAHFVKGEPLEWLVEDTGLSEAAEPPA